MIDFVRIVMIVIELANKFDSIQWYTLSNESKYDVQWRFDLI